MCLALQCYTISVLQHHCFCLTSPASHMNISGATLLQHKLHLTGSVCSDRLYHTKPKDTTTKNALLHKLLQLCCKVCVCAADVSGA